MKTCTKCETSKPLDDFRPKRNHCRQCEYAYKKEQRKTAEGRLARQKESKKYKELYGELISEREKVNGRKYRQSEKGREFSYRRNMRKRSLGFKVDFTPHQRVDLLNRDGWRCRHCGMFVHNQKDNTRDKAHIDHIIPISKGGNSEPGNLQVLCRTCNLSKSNKIIVHS